MLLIARNESVPHCPVTQLNKGDRVGLSITAAAGTLSAAAILVVVFMVVRQAVRGATKGKEPMKRPIFKTHIDVYMVSLLLSDMCQAVGALLNLRHVHLGRSECSPFCTAQGVLKSLGEPSAAMATLAITIHTFCVIFFHWTPSQRFIVPGVIISIIWLYVSLYVGLAYAFHHSPGHEFFQPVPYWCWVGSAYPADRISAEYFWLWLSAFSAIVLYVPLWLLIRGNLTVDSQRPWVVTFHHASQRRHGAAFDRARHSLKMLFYPAVYIIVVLPLSVTRWILFNGHSLAPVWTFVGIVPFHLSGLGNVLLLVLTRPSILVFGAKDGTRQEQSLQLQSPPQSPGLRMPDVFAVNVHIEEILYDDALAGDKLYKESSSHVGSLK